MQIDANGEVGAQGEVRALHEAGPLLPLPYHLAVTDILERENPRSFAALLPGAGEQSAELDQALLRSTYRLDPTGHPAVHEAVARAATALGITVPVELYADDAGTGNNAELIFLRSKAVLIFSGDTLNILDDAELSAVAGHELAHHVLWTAGGGRHLAASRLLDAAESDARTPSEYLETARRFRLATELFADRGALLAGGSPDVAVSGLLKLTTGLRSVDPRAYLRQAAEVDFSKPSAGTTHPETILRAWALQLWHAAARPDLHADAQPDPHAAADEQIARALAPSLDLASLDIVGQGRLGELTRSLVAAVVSLDQLQGADEIELAERFGVAAQATPVAPPDLGELPLSSDTRRYLAAVLVDFATVDPDGGADNQAAALVLAQRAGIFNDTKRLLVHELGLSQRAETDLAARVEVLGASA